MIDPLVGFDWSSLYTRYDARCFGFDSRSSHLSRFGSDRPMTDRQLYYRLVKCLTPSDRATDHDPVALYESLLYWKLYSQPAAKSQIGRWLEDGGNGRKTVGAEFPCLLKDLPPTVERDLDGIVDLIVGLGRYGLPGMKSDTAIPVRSTLLHFLYPSSVPIFDKMVLQAVGVFEDKANQSIEVFRQYLTFVWKMADRHWTEASGDHSETSLRLMDMALWITRGNSPVKR